MPVVDHPRFEIDAAPRQHRVSADELREPHFRVAEGQAEAVVVGSPGQVGEAGVAQQPQQRRHAGLRQHRHRGDILGARQRGTRAQRTAIATVVVARRVDDPLLRGRKALRHIREHGRGRRPLLERDRVRERLERRSRLPQRGHAIDRAAERLAEVVARSLPRQPLARAVVEHRHRRRVRAVREELRALGGDDALHLALQVGVERCADDAALRRLFEHAFDEVRGDERLLAAIESQTFVRRRGALRGSQRHPREYPALPLRRGLRIAQRIERPRPLRQRGQERGLRVRQLLGGDAEVTPARADDAGRLIAVRREVQVEREELALRVAMFEPQRDDGLAYLLRERARLRIEEELCHLLRDRRAALDDASSPHVV